VVATDISGLTATQIAPFEVRNEGDTQATQSEAEPSSAGSALIVVMLFMVIAVIALALVGIVTARSKRRL
jgi:hypothetical protein